MNLHYSKCGKCRKKTLALRGSAYSSGQSRFICQSRITEGSHKGYRHAYALGIPFSLGIHDRRQCNED